MVNVSCLIIVGFVTGLCLAKTKFIHMNGVNMIADTLSNYSTTDRWDCFKQCATVEACVGVQMLARIKTCRLITMIRNAYEAIECSYYIKEVATVVIADRWLNKLEQYLQNSVYTTQGACPYGFDTLPGICVLLVTKETCNEYATFLEATYDDLIGCYIPILRENGTTLYSYEY
uniref:Apple domain-containing protein n=1 Tax=Panagrellus redivivus TaxID=6233 RepID=A0A7E4ZRJ6_PANRE